MIDMHSGNVIGTQMSADKMKQNVGIQPAAIANVKMSGAAPGCA